MASGTRAPRDRDQNGRARNARPRDRLGRPLPRRLDNEPAEPPDYSHLSPAEALANAQALLDASRPFEAHELLEAAWKSAPSGERQAWRGLAQLAVGITHAARGNRAGAIALVGRGRDNLKGAAQLPAGIDIVGLVGWADRALTQLLTDGPATVELAPPRLCR